MLGPSPAVGGGGAEGAGAAAAGARGGGYAHRPAARPHGRLHRAAPGQGGAPQGALGALRRPWPWRFA